MIKLFDRVKVNIPTTGTGDVTFGAAASTAFLTPAEAGVLDSDEVRYVIVDGLDFEEGVGLIKDTVATMERTVTKSKIGGVVGTSALNLSGTAVLALTASAADILTPDDNLASLVDADAALDNLGGTAIGKALFEASNSDAALAELGVGATGADIAKADDEADVLYALPSVYHKDNVIGAVGWNDVNEENTGAVIESGSNANGYYEKLADGTLKCWRSAVSNGTTSPTTVAWPAQFVDNGYSVSTMGGSGSASSIVNAKISARTETSVSFIVVVLNAGNTTNPAVATDLIAVGRWRA